jgi:hypothetical protein
VEPNGYPFVPFSVESYGRIGQLSHPDSWGYLIHGIGRQLAPCCNLGWTLVLWVTRTQEAYKPWGTLKGPDWFYHLGLELLHQPAMKLLHALGDEATSPGGVMRASFVAGTMREISVGLCGGNFMYRACLGMIAKSSGTGFRVGMRVPTDEHGLLTLQHLDQPNNTCGNSVCHAFCMSR